MVKMASTFKQQKPAKNRNKIYFDVEQQKPLQVPNASKEKAIKVYKKHVHKKSDSADPTAVEMAVQRSRGNFDLKTVLVQPHGPLTRPRNNISKHEEIDGEGLRELYRSQRLWCHLKQGRRRQRVGSAIAPPTQESLPTLGMGWQHRVRQVAPLTQESQQPKQINWAWDGLTANVWPSRAQVCSLGVTQLSQPSRAMTPKRAQVRRPNGQKVGRRTVSMAAKFMDGSGELPSLETRRPRRQPTLEGGSVGLPVAGEPCSPDPQQTRLPGEPIIPPELKTERTTVSRGEYRYVHAPNTYILHVNRETRVPVRTVVKAPITLPGIGHEGYVHPPGERTQRVVTCQGTHRNTKTNEGKGTKGHTEATTMTVEVTKKTTRKIMKLIMALCFLLLVAAYITFDDHTRPVFQLNTELPPWRTPGWDPPSHDGGHTKSGPNARIHKGSPQTNPPTNEPRTQALTHAQQVNKRIRPICEWKPHFITMPCTSLYPRGTNGVYPWMAYRNGSRNTQPTAPTKSRTCTTLSAQVTSTHHIPDKTFGATAKHVTRPTHSGSAAQAAQHVSNTVNSVEHLGITYQNMIARKNYGIPFGYRPGPTHNPHARSRGKSADHKKAGKRWTYGTSDAPEKFNVITRIKLNLSPRPNTNRKRNGHAGGNGNQSSHNCFRETYHVGTKQEKCETNKTACQKPNRETASPASRHTVGKRTHGNANEMGKQSTRSKTKKNQMAQDNERGNTIKDKELSYSLNADTNPDDTNFENTQHLDAASTQPDTAVTSQGTNVGDPSMTLPGMEGIAEGKRDTPNDQVMDEVMLGQQTGPADSAPPVSQVTTGIPLITTQNAPAIAAQAMTAGSSEQPTFQAPLPHP